ncbi:hypothetical protein FHR22_000139 [Sphingopyxis panaciterrae]|uniref:type II toxin-antitoxin system VapC family toxin n=1 Tax=Sphingopyxis panaciterrae TaxID=363841 RepID=UPI00141E09D0|nr:type II toxin-antitoxin system VapC family toxin [Sphingopyxis panaciterrae]NIJ35490.1 hypothetical protein [Sphingopyxis panaciterrae]
MTTYVDTNVLIDLLEPDSQHHAWSTAAVEKAKAVGPILVSDAVYSEFSISMETEDQANEVLETLSFSRCGYSDQALFRAGKAYAQYRQNLGTKLNVLPDFYIGAQADVDGVPVLTRDPGKLGTYFPNVALITP